MHSSRMHTARLLTISRSIQRIGVFAQGGVPPRGGVCLGGVFQHAMRQTPLPE